MGFQLTLIRHGRTEANEKRIYSGCTDLPVTEGGLKEIEELAASGLYEEGEVYYTSTLMRTEQTLYKIFGEVPHKKIEDLREINVGEFSMRSYEELKEVPQYIQWITDETGDYVCPGGESQNSFTQRVLEAFAKLTREIEESGVKKAVLVCHGGVMSMIIQKLFNVGDNFFEYVPGNGEGYILKYDQGKYVGYSNLER